MARGTSGDVMNINFEKLEKDVRSIEGERFAGTKISEFIMGCDKTYWNYMKSTGRCNKKCLEKLCSYYNLKVDEYTAVEKPVEAKPTSTGLNVDTLIVGVNQLYQIEKANNELMTQILEQLKISNTKVNRLENAIGQILANSIQIKESNDDILKENKEVKSSVAIINGRVRDILQIQNKR